MMSNKNTLLLSYLLRDDCKVKLMVVATMRTEELIDHAIEHFISVAAPCRRSHRAQLAISNYFRENC